MTEQGRAKGEPGGEGRAEIPHLGDLAPGVSALSEAILLEGHLLYPYAASALKNQHRYPLGTLYPESFCRRQDAGDPSHLQLEALAWATAEATVDVRFRFLQYLCSEPEVREVTMPGLRPGALAQGPASVTFAFPPMVGQLTASAAEVRPGLWKLVIGAFNRSASDVHPARESLPRVESERDHALRASAASPHILLSIAGGSWISLIDPPTDVADVALGCKNVGTFPVLVGHPGSRDLLLAAPIILPDHPALAPESPGDFFDSTDIDELLTLRVLTLTPEEKQAMAAGDGRARSLLERTEALGHQLLPSLHGACRGPVAGLRPGAKVRLRPRGRADIMDLALAGMAATVHAVERDFEGRTHVAVTIDEDPGKDLGVHGHRFFFAPEELELP